MEEKDPLQDAGGVPLGDTQDEATLRTVDTKTLRRASIIGLLVFFGFAFLLVRILLLQTVGYEKYQNKVINQMTTEAEVVAARGKIYDRNGVLLATNITTYRVFIAPRTIAEMSEAENKDYPNLIANELSAILGVTTDHVLKQTTYTKYLDRTIARQVSEETAELIEKSIERYGLEDMVYLQAGSTRYYPHGTLACHVLGFTGSDGAGQYGLELQYDDELSGTNGKYIVARDSRGNEMPYEYHSYIEAQDGNSIVTTLDIHVQAALEEQLKTTYIESGGKERACGIVTDTDTGEILAMAIYPDFDLNDPRALNSDCQAKLDASGYEEGSAEYTKLRQELQLQTWSNKAINEAYMPGSTFKIVTASMAYEQDLVDTFNSRGFYCRGYHVVAGRRIRCHKVQGHGSLTFAEALQQSCNPGMMTMGELIGQETFYNYVESFGYLEKTGIDLPGESGSAFWDRGAFAFTDLMVASFGQNFEISPIQQVMAVTTVANGGYLMTPYLVKEVQDSKGNTLETYRAETRRQVITTETARTVAAILEDGVSGDGGANNAYVAGYRVAAKTGTSEKIRKKNELGDGRDYYVCSCVGFAPADDPKIAVLIMVDEPTAGVLYGSVVAAPYLGKVMEQVLPYLGVDAVYTDKELANQAIKTPSAVGWSRTSIERYADEFEDFEIVYVGDGDIVTAQSPDAGTVVERANPKLILYTEKGLYSGDEQVSVPDLSGMTAAAANAKLASCQLNIRIEGTNNYLSGTGAVAVSQSIAAGSQVQRGTVITVTFRNKTDEDASYGDIGDVSQLPSRGEN